MKFSAFSSFFGFKDQQTHPKIFIKTPLSTHNWHVWVKHVKHLSMVVNLLFITCKQLISIIFENSCISAFKEKHFLWKFKHQRHKLPETGFLNICVSWHHILITFFVTFESIRIFSSSKYNEIPNFNPQKSHKRP